MFHGRDAPPDARLYTRRSRLLRVTERGESHAQVNRPLLSEFAGVLGGFDWEIALLQEAPPRWLRPLCAATRAGGVSALTSRNFGAGARTMIARRNPDLMASGEGGSNQLLVRPPWRVGAAERVTLTRRPERRRMLLARLEGPGGTLAVANLHASAGDRVAAEGEARFAVERAVAFAGHVPLLFGGDLNLRPAHSPALFRELEERFGLASPTAPGAIDHLLVRGLAVVAAPRALAAGRREVLDPATGLAVRLSDHAPVAAAFSAGRT